MIRVVPNPMRLLRNFIGTVIVILLITACQGSGSKGFLASPIVASMGEDVITLTEFQKALAASGGQLPFDEASEEAKVFKRNLLDQLIDQRLLLAEATSSKLEVNPQELKRAMDQMKGGYSAQEFQQLMEDQQISLEDWEEKLRQEILIQKLIQQAVDRQIEVTEEEIAEYHAAHRDELRQIEMVRARQIVVATEKEAQEIRELIMNGDDFIKVAKARSVSPDGAHGGDLGFFAKGEMPEEFDVVFGLKTGEISPGIKSPYGYHLFKVEEHRPSRILNQTEATEKIRKILTERKRKRHFSEWMAGLRQKANIKINHSILFSPLPRDQAQEGRLL